MLRTHSFLMLAGLLLVVAGCNPTSQDGAERPSSTKTTMAAPASPANDTLLAAASPFEDLTEFAEAGDVRGMERALASIKQHLPSAKAVLGDTPKAYLDSLVTDIEEAFGNGEYRTVALLAVEAYRTLISALDESAMVVPKAVSLLDYAGFKLHVLAGADAPDWDLMQRVVQEADGFWNSIEGQIDEKGLRDAMNTAIQGMKEALSARDARLMAFAARVDLDLVDLLETYFEDHPQRP